MQTSMACVEIICRHVLFTEYCAVCKLHSSSDNKQEPSFHVHKYMACAVSASRKPFTMKCLDTSSASSKTSHLNNCHCFNRLVAAL